ncbi:MAG: 4Fe-4S dicluster domain-containing protein [Deltaproteobacteria bacterium]|nr:4Fe-4S dicluster domain-containing protein [Deltaproteobacteria bacterium]
MKVEEKVALCAIRQHQDSHIEIDQACCSRCPTRICLRACPAGLYSLSDESAPIKLDHSGCLECGTCMIVCPLSAVSWNYPAPGFGIHYRHG